MGLRYPADPPTVEELVAVLRRAGPTPYGFRARTVIVLLWRAGRTRLGTAVGRVAAGEGITLSARGWLEGVAASSGAR